jgi:hypothetical protein
MSASGERMVPVNGVELCVETFGDRSDPAVLLVHGAAASRGRKVFSPGTEPGRWDGNGC